MEIEDYIISHLLTYLCYNSLLKRYQIQPQKAISIRKQKPLYFQKEMLVIYLEETRKWRKRIRQILEVVDFKPLPPAVNSSQDNKIYYIDLRSCWQKIRQCLYKRRKYEITIMRN